MEAIYARQSLDKKDSLSIETQIELCKLETSGNDIRVYIDKGFSGKNTNRPQFTKMMEDVENGFVSKVIVYKLDRLSRSLLDFAAMIDQFKRCGVEFLSTREKFDTSTPIGNAMLSIIMVFAQLERETIQIRVRDSFQARSERGAYDAIAPYGYQKTKAIVQGKTISTLDIEERTTPVVQELFHTYAFSDKSLGSMAKDLNARSIPSPSGAKWDSGKISRIMSNPIYVKADADIYRFYKNTGIRLTNSIDDFLGENGCVTYGAWDHSRRKFSQMESLSLSIGLHPGIIPSDTFLRCQQKLSSNTHIGNEGKGKYTWLTGSLKCGYCNHAMRVVASGRCIPRITCSGKTNYGICSQHEKRWILSEVEASIERELLKMVNKKQKLAIKSQPQEDVQQQRLKIQIAKSETKIENLLNAIAEANDISAKYLNEKISSLEREKQQLKKEMQLYQNDKKNQQDMMQFGDILLLWDKLSLDQKRQVGKLMIEKIQVYNEKVQIVWKYNFVQE